MTQWVKALTAKSDGVVFGTWLLACPLEMDIHSTYPLEVNVKYIYTCH